MNTQEIINALRLQGHKVSARKRTDGGWIITKIDRTKYKGAEGNMRARDLLGISYSKKRLEQARYNVSQYIRGKKKQRTLDERIKAELRKVQRVWRKNKVQGRITALNVKRHIKEFGKEEALEYLKRQTRYGQGYAYDKNVEHLAQYIDDVAESIRIYSQDEETAQQMEITAQMVRAKSSAFKDKWINIIYDLLYEVRNSGFDVAKAKEVIRQIIALVG